MSRLFRAALPLLALAFWGAGPAAAADAMSAIRSLAAGFEIGTVETEGDTLVVVTRAPVLPDGVFAAIVRGVLCPYLPGTGVRNAAVLVSTRLKGRTIPATPVVCQVAAERDERYGIRSILDMAQDWSCEPGQKCPF